MPKLSQVLQGPAAAESAPSAETSKSTPAVQGSQASIDAAIANLQTLHQRRLNQHGPRQFRHPDGSLQDHPPSRNPYTVANRKQWHVLATYCRTTGKADRDVVRTGISVRHGVGITPAQHTAALAAIGLRPEHDPSGAWEGFAPGHTTPLDSPDHVFNQAGPWAQLADQVFKAAPFQWHNGITTPSSQRA